MFRINSIDFYTLPRRLMSRIRSRSSVRYVLYSYLPEFGGGAYAPWLGRDGCALIQYTRSVDYVIVIRDMLLDETASLMDHRMMMTCHGHIMQYIWIVEHEFALSLSLSLAHSRSDLLTFILSMRLFLSHQWLGQLCNDVILNML